MPPIGGNVSEEEFPELIMLQEMQRRRHRKVIWGLIVGGVVSIAAGLIIFAFAGEKGPQAGTGPVGIVLTGVGLVMIVRGIVSATTDYDTRPRHDLDALPPEFYEETPEAEPTRES